MLLGVYGFTALGKTYFLEQNLDKLADVAAFPITVVIADNAQEYHLEDDEWVLESGNKPRWGGRREQKLQWPPQELIADRSRIWIVDSSRYFGGMGPELSQGAVHNNGGMRMVLPTTTPELARQFLQERKALQGKVLTDYWAPDKFEYEVIRASNFWRNWLEPVGVPAFKFEVDEQRSAWVTQAWPVFEDWLGDRNWYNG